MKTYYGVILAGLMTAATPALAAQTNPPTVWEGRVYVTQVTSACSFQSFAGDSFTSVYRPKFDAADDPEGLTIVYPRAASVLISTAPDGLLVRSPAALTTFNGTLVGNRASPIFWSTTARLLKQPAVVTTTTPTVTISGTINNFNVAGCTITIRGAYIRVPFPLP